MFYSLLDISLAVSKSEAKHNKGCIVIKTIDYIYDYKVNYKMFPFPVKNLN